MHTHAYISLPYTRLVCIHITAVHCKCIHLHTLAYTWIHMHTHGIFDLIGFICIISMHLYATICMAFICTHTYEWLSPMSHISTRLVTYVYGHIPRRDSESACSYTYVTYTYVTFPMSHMCTRLVTYVFEHIHICA